MSQPPKLNFSRNSILVFYVFRVKCELDINPAFSHQVIAISINGTTHQFERLINVSELIEHMQIGNKRIAIERNGEIVPRGQFNQQMLADGDKLEVVVAVGGG